MARIFKLQSIFFFPSCFHFFNDEILLSDNVISFYTNENKNLQIITLRSAAKGYSRSRVEDSRHVSSSLIRRGISPWPSFARAS